MTTSRVHLIAAARPNFMKVAPLWHALAQSSDFEPVLIHTGQHYSANMSDEIFEDLKLPAPVHSLGIGSGTHAEQTGRVMIAYEALAKNDRPDWTIVVGDVNSTAACALAATKLGIPTVHLEAGLRSRDRTMPEELNRLVTDVLSDVLWTPSEDADENLRTEGIPIHRVTRVGNIMLDSFEMVRPRIEAADVAAELGVRVNRYAVVTLHRPSNVDDPAKLGELVRALSRVQRDIPLVFPLHPRTAGQLSRTGLRADLDQAGIRLIEPLSYVRFMSLVLRSALVITDSGGIQEETTYLGIPCLTLRANTERPITVTHGTNRLVRPAGLPDAVLASQASRAVGATRPALWDGRTAGRCVEDLLARASRISGSGAAPG